MSIQELVAAGRIPLAFDMHASEVTSLQRPPVYFCMAPRTSYLPLVSRAAKEAFAEHAPDVGEGGVWYEYDNKPLRWNLPLGVLFDYYCKTSNSNCCLPFKITVRFLGFPSANLLPCRSELDVESAFFHSMKQALSLYFNSAQRLMEMPKAKQEELWQGVLLGKGFEHDFLTLRSGSVSEATTIARLPIRVVTRIAEQLHVLQASIPLQDDMTLECAVKIVLEQSGNEVNVDRIIVHGIFPNKDAPVRQVWEEMCYQDLFLYVVI